MVFDVRPEQIAMAITGVEALRRMFPKIDGWIVPIVSFGMAMLIVFGVPLTSGEPLHVGTLMLTGFWTWIIAFGGVGIANRVIDSAVFEKLNPKAQPVMSIALTEVKPAPPAEVP